MASVEAWFGKCTFILSVCTPNRQKWQGSLTTITKLEDTRSLEGLLTIRDFAGSRGLSYTSDGGVGSISDLAAPERLLKFGFSDWKTHFHISNESSNKFLIKKSTLSTEHLR